MCGLLEQVLQESVVTLSTGVRTHAKLALESADTMDLCFERDQWACKHCRVRLPEYMEVEHKEHCAACELDDMHTVCQFCHNLRHLVWASSRGKVKLIWFPSISQVFLHRLAWTVVLTTGKLIQDDMIDEAVADLMACINRREMVMAEVVGSSDPLTLFEALLTVRRLEGPDSFLKKVRFLDEFVRFWPTAAYHPGQAEIEPSAKVSVWKKGRFRDMSDQVRDSFRFNTNAFHHFPDTVTDSRESA